MRRAKLIHLSSRKVRVLGHFGSTSRNTNYSGRTMHAHLLRAPDDVTSAFPQIRLTQACSKREFPFPNLVPGIPFSWKNYDVTSGFPKVPQSLAPLSEPSTSRPLAQPSRILPQTPANLHPTRLRHASQSLPKVFLRSS
jgi:hypothetical protein